MSNHLCGICNQDTDINGIRYATMTPSHVSTYYCKSCVQASERVVEKKVCSHCDNELSEKVLLVIMKKEVAESKPIQIIEGGGIPDVWYGYGSGTHSEENIADPKTGEPIPFWDKASKRDAMRRAGVKEAGDRIHGYRNEDMTPGKRKTYFT